MLSKCANPSCSAQFRYLSEGRIFTLLAGPHSEPTDLVWDQANETKVERYWLCQVCSQTMTVCRVKDRTVVRQIRGHPGAPAARECQDCLTFPFWEPTRISPLGRSRTRCRLIFRTWEQAQ